MTITDRLETATPPEADFRRRVAAARELRRRDRDELLYQAVVGYRIGERSAWSPLIFGLMDMAIRVRVARYRPIEPTMAIEDVYQQLACEVLHDALTLPLDGPAFLERRLILRSADRVSRWLQRQHRRAEGNVSLEAWVQEHEEVNEEDPS